MNKKLPKILYIDDEEWNLTAFRFMFRDEFEVFVAGDTDTAEKILGENLDIDVVISDQRMPEETGVQFFERMRPRLSSTERIILTGYSDIDAVIASINRAGVYFYLRKPWQEEEVRLVLRNAIASTGMHRKLVEHEETLRLIEDYVNEVIARTDLDGCYLYVSPAIERAWGYLPEEIVGKKVMDFLHPDDVTKYAEVQNQACRTKQTQTMTCRMRHKGGLYLQIETKIQGAWKNKDSISELVSISREVGS